MITRMKKVLLAGRSKDRQEVLELLQKAGVVHVEPVDPESVEVPGYILKEISQAKKISENLSGIAPPADAVPSPGSPTSLVLEAIDLLDELSRTDAIKSEIHREIQRVAPWGAIGAKDLDVLRKNGLHVEFFICPEKMEEGIEADIRKVITTKDGQSYVIAVSKNSIQSSAEAVRMPQPARDVVELQAALDHQLGREKEIRESLGRIAVRRREIDARLQELLVRKQFIEVENSLMEEGPIFVLQGWIPAAEGEDLKARFDQAALTVAVDLSQPAETDMPPTKLENSSWCRPIEVLYKVLGVTPGYRESDISPFFLPFLTIFTAMLFADAGYGIVMLIPLIAGYKVLSAKGVPTQLLNLFIILFSGVVAYGLLTNAFFGTKLIQLTSFDPMSPEGEAILKKACFLIGSVHISLAHIWKLRQKPIGLGSLAEIGWILFTWAMFALICMLVLGDPQPEWMIPLFGVALALVIMFTAPSWNIFLAVGKGLGAVALSAASFLSDIISYIRLWAVGLAAGILAASFNDLARPLPFVFAAVILFAAHFMNIALGMVAVFAHGVRLNLLEFSNHVGMEWSGREYNPFRKE